MNASRTGRSAALIVTGLLAIGCGSQPGGSASTTGQEGTSPSATDAPSVSTSTASPPSTSTTVPTPTTDTVVPDVNEGTIEIPSGEISVGPNDLLVVHVDGDLWLHPGALGDVSGTALRLADLGDPRVEVVEGPGPNAVDDVAGEVNGAVFFSDCCEPISGNLLAATSENSDRITLGPGYSPVLNPDRTKLATANSYGLSVIDLSTGSYAARSLDNGVPFINAWDLMWTPDGASLVMLYSDDSGFGLMPFSAESPFVQGAPTSLGLDFDPSTSPSVHLAGRGPTGEIAVAVGDSKTTLIRYFDAATLLEIPQMQRDLPAGVQSVRLANDGVGLLWIDKTTLWYLPANGDVRDLGFGYSAAWFAT